MAPKIVTTFVYPPIPDRRCDWQAIYDDDEPNDDGQMAAGWGRTEAEAIADLTENHPREIDRYLGERSRDRSCEADDGATEGLGGLQRREKPCSGLPWHTPRCWRLALG